MSRDRALPICWLTATIVALPGCGLSNPYSARSHAPAPSAASATATNPAQNPGESPAPAPPSATGQSPLDPASTPQSALARFASLYTNWTWKTLHAHQLELAALSVGAARLSEQQAASASTHDSEIARAQVVNRGQIIAIARSQAAARQWVIVTREETGGNAEYDGRQAAYHVTLAQFQQLPDGRWAVSEWLPQS